MQGGSAAGKFFFLAFVGNHSEKIGSLRLQVSTAVLVYGDIKELKKREIRLK